MARGREGESFGLCLLFLLFHAFLSSSLFPLPSSLFPLPSSLFPLRIPYFLFLRFPPSAALSHTQSPLSLSPAPLPRLIPSPPQPLAKRDVVTKAPEGSAFAPADRPRPPPTAAGRPPMGGFGMNRTPPRLPGPGRARGGFGGGGFGGGGFGGGGFGGGGGGGGGWLGGGGGGGDSDDGDSDDGGGWVERMAGCLAKRGGVGGVGGVGRGGRVGAGLWEAWVLITLRARVEMWVSGRTGGRRLEWPR
jgi:hypothetical protein